MDRIACVSLEVFDFDVYRYVLRYVIVVQFTAFRLEVVRMNCILFASCVLCSVCLKPVTYINHDYEEYIFLEKVPRLVK